MVATWEYTAEECREQLADPGWKISGHGLSPDYALTTFRLLAGTILEPTRITVLGAFPEPYHVTVRIEIDRAVNPPVRPVAKELAACLLLEEAWVRKDDADLPLAIADYFPLVTLVHFESAVECRSRVAQVRPESGGGSDMGAT